MKERSESGTDVEIAMVDKKRSGLTKASMARGSRKTSMFGAFSFSQSTVSHTEDGTVSKMDAARITAPFIMGHTTQQTMPCICIDKKGKSTEKSIVKHQFAKQIGVHIRDLRIIEKSPANRVEAAINPRTNCIIVSMENVKLVIFRTEVYVFCPDEEMVPKFIELLKNNIATHSHSSGHHSDDDEDFPDIDHSTSSHSLGIVMSRFEHLVLESLFSCACNTINDTVIQLSSDLNETFQALNDHAQANEDHRFASLKRKKQTRKIKDMIRKSEMSPIKTKLQKLKKKAFEISRVLLVLLEDEDIFSRLFLNNLSFSLDDSKGGNNNRLNSRTSLDIGGTGFLRKSFGSALVKLRNEFNAQYQNGAFPPTSVDDVNDDSNDYVDEHHSPHSAEHQTNSMRLEDFHVGNPLLSGSRSPSSAYQSAAAVNLAATAAVTLAPSQPVNPRDKEISGNSMLRDLPGNNRPFAGPKKKRGSVIQPMMMTSAGFGAPAAVPMGAGAGDSPPTGASVGRSISPSPKRVSIRMEQQQMQQQLQQQQQQGGQPQQQTAMISLEDVQNLELILDNFISQFNWISSEIDDLLDQLVNAEVNAALQLDIVRNRIMRYTVYLSMLAIAISLAALVTGIFGMNLEFPSALYDTMDPFKLTVSFITVSIPVVFFILFWAGSRRGIF